MLVDRTILTGCKCRVPMWRERPDRVRGPVECACVSSLMIRMIAWSWCSMAGGHGNKCGSGVRQDEFPGHSQTRKCDAGSAACCKVRGAQRPRVATAVHGLRMADHELKRICHWLRSFGGRWIAAEPPGIAPSPAGVPAGRRPDLSIEPLQRDPRFPRRRSFRSGSRPHWRPAPAIHVAVPRRPGPITAEVVPRRCYQ
jgi:hypothetical protein